MTSRDAEDDDDDDDDVRFLTRDEFVTVFGRAASSRDASIDAPWRIAIETMVTQTCEWDCGYACAASVIDALVGEGKEMLTSAGSVARAGRASRGGAWTIDLARAMREHGCEMIVFVTTATRARAAYGRMEFYADDFLRDCARVNGAFARALRGDFAGLEVFRRRMTSDDIDRALRSGAFACIALVCRRRLLGMEADDSDDFIGHYVIVAASPNTNASSFRVLDPARHEGGETRENSTRFQAQEYEVSFDAFDAARTAFGTDEDLLFVSTRRSDFNRETWTRARTRFTSAA